MSQGTKRAPLLARTGHEVWVAHAHARLTHRVCVLCGGEPGGWLQVHRRDVLDDGTRVLRVASDARAVCVDCITALRSPAAVLVSEVEIAPQ